MNYQTILSERRGPVALITLNRPERLNAISQRMIDELNHALDSAEKDEGARAVVLTGAGRAFSAGFDLKDGAAAERKGVADWRPLLERDCDIILRFWYSRLPTIAAARGYCMGGGCELALACDITIAAEGTFFGEPELRFGSGIVTMIMPWLTGPKQAKELLLLAQDRLSAERALAIGLVNRVVPLGHELDTALALARDLAVMDRDAVSLTKQAINRTLDIMGMREALRAALDLDVEIESLETPERRTFKEITQRDGLKAALAWRDARFGQGGAKSPPES